MPKTGKDTPLLKNLLRFSKKNEHSPAVCFLHYGHRRMHTVSLLKAEGKKFNVVVARVCRGPLYNPKAFDDSNTLQIVKSSVVVIKSLSARDSPTQGKTQAKKPIEALIWCMCP